MRNFSCKWVNPADRVIAGFLLLLLTAAPILADECRLPFVFSDNMMLQREMADPIWGRAKPGDKITVKFAGQEKTAVTDADGLWMLKLAPMPANAHGQELSVIDGDQNIILKNILLGEVWLCSGQSNMEKAVQDQHFGGKSRDHARNRQSGKK
jgi:sialate O-acetylesterase